jgi:2-haloacid dehalogenase
MIHSACPPGGALEVRILLKKRKIMQRSNPRIPGRRSFLRDSALLSIAGTLSGTGLLASLDAWSQTSATKPVDGVRALFFDVYGTLVDWRNGVAREAAAILKPLGYSLDWIAFADAWRAGYRPGMEEVRSGAVPFSKLDVIHRRMLERIRTRFGLESLDEPVLRELNLAWHRLDAWKGVPAGLHRLRRRFLLAPCSNGNISLMVNLARRNDFRWDAILGAEIAGDYKPKPRVYLAAAEAFSLAPEQCMMVAAHSADLKAAAALGLHTAHVVSADEFGPNIGETAPKVPGDFAVRSLMNWPMPTRSEPIGVRPGLT